MKEGTEHESTNDLEPVEEETSDRYADELSYNSKETSSDYDLMDFLPKNTDFLNDDQTTQSKDKQKPKDKLCSLPQSPTVNKTQKQPEATQEPKFISRPADSQSFNSITDSEKDANDPVEQFFSWLRSGIQKGEIKTNRPKARVHVVEEGVALITPGIFQDYALSQKQDKPEWTVIQKKVLKKSWHVKNEQGLNMISYQVKGNNKSTKINVILFPDTSRVFGENKSLNANPHLFKE